MNLVASCKIPLAVVMIKVVTPTYEGDNEGVCAADRPSEWAQSHYITDKVRFNDIEKVQLEIANFAHTASTLPNEKKII